MKKLLSVLVVCTLMMLSGCAGPDAVLTLDKINSTEELTESASTNATKTHSGILESVKSDTSNPTVRDTEFEGRFRIIEYKGTYYNLTKQKVGTTESKFASFNITKTDREADYNISKLPQKDAKPIQDFISHRERDDPPEIRIGQRYVQNERNKSILLDERQVVVSTNNTNYLVQLTEVNSRTEDLFVYESSVEFDNSTSYGQYIEEEFFFTIDSLPSNSTEVWSEANNKGGYYGGHTDGYENLREQFVQQKAFARGENSGVWFVRYNGDTYYAELRWIYNDS